jgi:hypothetical protein
VASLTDPQRARKDRWCTLVAAVTCPCHVPVAIAVLGGTAGVGGVLAAYQGWLMLAFGFVWLAAVVLLFGWRRTRSGTACPVQSPAQRLPDTNRDVS